MSKQYQARSPDHTGIYPSGYTQSIGPHLLPTWTYDISVDLNGRELKPENVSEARYASVCVVRVLCPPLGRAELCLTWKVVLGSI